MALDCNPDHSIKQTLQGSHDFVRFRSLCCRAHSVEGSLGGTTILACRGVNRVEIRSHPSPILLPNNLPSLSPWISKSPLRSFRLMLSLCWQTLASVRCKKEQVYCWTQEDVHGNDKFLFLLRFSVDMRLSTMFSSGRCYSPESAFAHSGTLPFL